MMLERAIKLIMIIRTKAVIYFENDDLNNIRSFSVRKQPPSEVLRVTFALYIYILTHLGEKSQIF